VNIVKLVPAVALNVLLLLAGCGQQHPVALVYIEDCTDSCHEGRAEFRRYFESLVVGGYLSKGQICIVHACSRPHVLYAGPARRAKEAKAAFERAAKPCPCTKTPEVRFCGSNPADALALARAWLAKPEFKDCRRMVVAWTDLINDPCTAGREPRTFPDPLKFSWAPVTAEVHVYGLPADKHDAVRKAWNGLQPAPCFHLPFETFEPQHLGLQAKAL